MTGCSSPARPVSSGCTRPRALLARGDTVVGVDNLDPYYDVALKEARLAALAGRHGFAFEKLDLADADGDGARCSAMALHARRASRRATGRSLFA